MTSQMDDPFTPYRALNAEGARIALVTCRRCGATVTLDPTDQFVADQLHLEWHAEQDAAAAGKQATHD